MDYKWKGTAELIVGIIIGSAITWGIMEYKCTFKQYNINLIGENMYTQLDDLKHANMIKEYLETNDVSKSIVFANKVASVVIQKKGVAVYN